MQNVKKVMVDLGSIKLKANGVPFYLNVEGGDGNASVIFVKRENEVPPQPDFRRHDLFFKNATIELCFSDSDTDDLVIETVSGEYITFYKHRHGRLYVICTNEQ